jgi:prolyl-tRNA synthetase
MQARKFRDERRPRGGLLRGREFLMKDMYSFDLDEKTAMETYGLVRNTYDLFFKSIGLPFVTVRSSPVKVSYSRSKLKEGISEERFVTSIITSRVVWAFCGSSNLAAGEDLLYRCTSCSYAKNSEVHQPEEDPAICPQCQMDTLGTSTAIEMGHTFYLGTKYSKVFNAKYTPHDDLTPRLTHMGCYGLGLSRMIGAIAEVSHDKEGIIWPEAVAPWKCVIIEKTPGKGESVYDAIASIIGTDNVLLDDRQLITAGWKLHDAKKIGYPHIVVLGKKWENTGLIEVIRRKSGESLDVEQSALLDPQFWSTG